MLKLTSDTRLTSYQEPIRSEIFTLARLEMHAESLAHAQRVTSDRRFDKKLAPRIAENRKILEQSYLHLIDAVENHRAVTPAAEWLIDNFHIVRALLKDIHDHLPPQFYKKLPKLAEGPLAGYPRIYGIAWAFVAHTDSRFDPELLKGFLTSYQKVQPLTIGELWAVSITIRVVLIENLRRLAELIVGSQIARKEADGLADEILGLGETASRPIKGLLAAMEQKPLNGSFAVQLMQRLRFQESSVDPVLEWLETRMRKEGLVADEVVSVEHNSQTAANATVRNIITSSRLMAVFNWQVFFEETSLVDEVLNQHRDYRNMDFTSRDRYRHGLEELARYSDVLEIEIARKVLEKTRKASDHNQNPYDRSTDLGYYLISSGRRGFETEIGFRPPLRGRLTRWVVSHSTPLYIGSILGLSLLILVWPLMASATAGVSSAALLTALAVTGFFPASEIAVAIVNRLVVALMGPRYLPRLNLEKGIPADLKTFVVVPTMITQVNAIGEQLEQLEAHYLANPDGHILFALLTDWTDSKTERSPQDNVLINVAAEKLAALNKKYAQANGAENIFYIFHRKRLYNAQEGKWLGWERKRGKLEEFNHLLLGEGETTHILVSQEDRLTGRLTVPTGIRYIITLDADTKLPRGSVMQLVGTLAHPLNRARFDKEKGRVVDGYGILQPRITPALPSTLDSTIFQRISAGPSGVDPYASAISDVYQDLFGEGSFTGKGIYDLNAFHSALKGKVPENSLLSHDLFEGNYARCGFVSDIEFFEDFPSHSGVAALRSHRWTRGDWQLLPWIFGPRGFSIPLIGRWKMADNLRRSLAIPATFLTFVLPFMIPSLSVSLWLGLALLSMGTSVTVSFVSELVSKPAAVTFQQHIRFALHDFALGCGRSIFFLALLPYHAWMSCDAIARALFRLFISRRHMLEWTTAAQSKAAATLSVKSFWWSMRGSLGLIAVSTLLVAFFNIHGLPFAFLFICLWTASPSIAQFCSSPPRRKPLSPVKPENIQLLNLAARKIWRFFATFVTAEDNFLPPDNFQETPSPVVAHRSSPTNFGLYLLSVLAANDFGWIGLIDMSERLEATLKSLVGLAKHEGHFYNWYETTDRRPLEPRYISSVDNGNLAGHLLAVAQGCVEKLNQAVPITAFNLGTLDALLLLEKALAAQTDVEMKSKVSRAFDELATSLLTPDHLIRNRLNHWAILLEKAETLLNAAKSLAVSSPAADNSEILGWSRALSDDIGSSAQDFISLVSWSEFADEELPMGLSPEARNLWESIRKGLLEKVPLRESDAHCQKLIKELLEFTSLAKSGPTVPFTDALLECLENSADASKALVQRLEETYRTCHRLCREMDFGLLYDPIRKLFSIGLRVSENALDASYYDLLASEARLTSFIAIAKGDVPVAHWFSLGRTLTPVENGAALVSWSGSMFEYLMPALVMHTPPGSLLEQTCKLAIKRQISYATAKGVAWGISESAYNKRDLQLTYQYSNFGVPDLGLKRGLGADLVIAPYASFLASMFESTEAAENLARLEKEGASGPFGFYEAIDYTASRLPEGQTSAIVRAYMAHHQGMSLIAIANVFKDGIMRKRFHMEPLVQATELLLQERTPRNVRTIKPNEESFQIGIVREVSEDVSRKYHTVNRPTPTTELISNGNYTVMLTSAGSGFSRYREIALTRWREDVTRDHWGSYFYLRDLTNGKIWSATHQPTCVEADSYEVDFTEDRARFTRDDGFVSTKLEVFVSPEDNAEIRKVTLTNNGTTAREIEITSYSEVVLNSQGADVAHPAFSNLFIQTEYISEVNSLFATRRPRSSTEAPLWMAQVLLPSESSLDAIEYETDRALFLGRGRTARNPKALHKGQSLTNSVGSVLDPIFSLRTKVRIEPGTSASVMYSTMVADTREDLMNLAGKYHDRSTYERVTNLAWTQAQVKLHYLNVEPVEAHQYQRLATRLLYSDTSLRPSGEVLKRNVKDVTGLWAHGISGDFPMILLRIDDIEDRGIVRQLIKAQEYLATKRFVVDLVIINEKANSYAQELQNTLEAMVHSSTVHSPLPQSRGKVFILRADILAPGDLDLLYSEARAALSSRLGNLAEQVKRVRFAVKNPTISRKSVLDREILHSNQQLEIPELKFFNGLGGFTEDAREYVVVLKDDNQTPAPWINVIANSEFGFQVSESGSGYTWAKNSRENQITPWTNDPVCDPTGEAFYICDRDTGELWSPTALPIRREETIYLARHGQGYSRFENISHDIRSDLTQFVTAKDPVKISRLVLENLSAHTRKLSVAGYVEWVLGFSRSTMAPTTITEFDPMAGGIFAFNARNTEFGTRISFFCLSSDVDSFTGDRGEFIGRNGAHSSPAGLLNEETLSGKVGAGFDPCAALQTEIELAPGEKCELVFMLGQAESRSAAREILARARSVEPQVLLDLVIADWEKVLGKVQVYTPDPAFDFMINRWLLYQTLVCRFWARSAFYQAGGAFGFRDQLQDVMSLMLSHPDLAREHIMRSSGRQFADGDVQHWWHPPSGRGVRTHFSDDLLWLPYVVSHYLKVTHDHSLLRVETPFLEGPALRADQEDSYFTPTVSHRAVSVYEHCALAIERSMKTGAHGLPLMGCGDWNDGMNRIG